MSSNWIHLETREKTQRTFSTEQLEKCLSSILAKKKLEENLLIDYLQEIQAWKYEW